MNEINVVPYIDVMLVLLVIFMVTAPLVNPALVDLPSVGKSSEAPVAPLEVVVRADTSLILRSRDTSVPEREIARDELAREVQRLQTATPDRAVVISADKSVRYEAVLQVMDQLQRLKIQRVGLMVRPSR
jgi:biopolymer transport protein TolR